MAIKFRILFACLAFSVSYTFAQNTTLKIPYEKFKLDNGLEVIFHIDRSDPVVAVALTAHVGSAREKAGRTGFAHLFEHLLFLESENLGKGGLDKMSARIGGSGANGSTNRDCTNYFQTVPKDALEKMIWGEADKLGWFINTVTEPVLAKEKQVVKNEKRRSYDNNPYGHTSYVVDKYLYPSDHPYNWQVIGSLDDLQNATVADVKDFFRRWYVPNNVTLVIAGDFNPVQAKTWVQKYFNEIKRGEEVMPLAKKTGFITETIKLSHEDNFARLPELTLNWVGVEKYSDDSYPLEVLVRYLSQGKNAPLQKVVVEEKKLSSSALMLSRNSELAGEIRVSIRAFAEKDLDEVSQAVFEAFASFEKDGIPLKDLNRIKSVQETDFYHSLLSVQGKGYQLANYSIYTSNPGFIEEDIKKTLAVTPEDVMRVYNKYIKEKKYIATSFVPKGKPDLAVEGSIGAKVVEETSMQGAEAKVDPTQTATYERTPSTFDRSKEPPLGKAPELKDPGVWHQKLANGMKLYGITNSEVPLVDMVISIDGGLLLDNPKKVGVANLLASMLNKGTKNKTTKELEDAFDELGAWVTMIPQTEDISIVLSVLRKNCASALALVQEFLLEPGWDPEEFELAKKRVIGQIHQQEGNPADVAQNNYNQLVFGKDNIRSRNILGTIESVNAITLDDLKDFYAKNISPSVARVLIIGDIQQKAAANLMSPLISNWHFRPVTIPKYNTAAPPEKSKVYFVDIPNAKQSVIRFGYPALAATDKDFYPVTVMNYILGGGEFASRLTQQLRELKGYTSNINSGFSGTMSPGPFTITSSVRTNVTLESAQAVKEILENFGKSYSEMDLETTKSSLIKSNARAYESLAAKFEILVYTSKYGWKSDYVKQREKIVKEMTVEKIKALSNKYLNPNRMIWMIAGDAKTQFPRMKELGFGEPMMILKQFLWISPKAR